MAVVAHFSGSPHDYRQGYTVVAWLLAVRPVRCPHCGAEHVCIFWGCYLRWVYTAEENFQIRIRRVRCTACGVTDALLPGFLHLFRRYTLALIQQALFLALEQGLWGRALADAVGPYHHPAPATIAEWVYAFTLAAQRWLLAWLQQRLLDLDPQATLDVGPLPAHCQTIPNPKRRAAFILGVQALRLAEALYAATRARKPDLLFQAQQLLTFLAVSLAATGHPPRLLWPGALARPP